MLKFLEDKKGQVEDWTDFLIAFLMLLFIIVIVGFVINTNEDRAKASIKEIGIGNILMTDLMAYLKSPAIYEVVEKTKVVKVFDNNGCVEVCSKLFLFKNFDSVSGNNVNDACFIDNKCVCEFEVLTSLLDSVDPLCLSGGLDKRCSSSCDEGKILECANEQCRSIIDVSDEIEIKYNEGVSVGNIGDLIILAYYDENIDDEDGYEAKLEEETKNIFSKLNPGCWVIKFHYFLDKELQVAYEDISLFGEPIGFIETRLPVENGYVDIMYSTNCIPSKVIEYVSIGSGS